MTRPLLAGAPRLVWDLAVCRRVGHVDLTPVGYGIIRQPDLAEKTSVGKHLRARGVDTTPLALAPDDVPAAAELYRHGWSLARIAPKFGTTASTVRTSLREAGVQMRRPWER